MCRGLLGRVTHYLLTRSFRDSCCWTNPRIIALKGLLGPPQALEERQQLTKPAHLQLLAWLEGSWEALVSPAREQTLSTSRPYTGAREQRRSLPEKILSRRSFKSRFFSSNVSFAKRRWMKTTSAAHHSNNTWGIWGSLESIYLSFFRNYRDQSTDPKAELLLRPKYLPDKIWRLQLNSVPINESILP